MSCWVEKNLSKAADHPNRPRVLIVAATGKAASIVGKKNTFLNHKNVCNYIFLNLTLQVESLFTKLLASIGQMGTSMSLYQTKNWLSFAFNWAILSL